ncbi:hypothetical protein VNO80_18947 [Phaseolus coccineus]|uniref:Uncharacterized protein n=1 Tax=Phaseolus coccineus TaxID=3886 RepID=A0AAN9MIM4_PHACN
MKRVGSFIIIRSSMSTSHTTRSDTVTHKNNRKRRFQLRDLDFSPLSLFCFRYASPSHRIAPSAFALNPLLTL